MLAALVRPKNLTLISAVLLALISGFFVWLYLASLRGNVANPAGQSRTVVVAAQFIPARAKITRDMLQLSNRPALDAEPDALIDPAAAVGAGALISIPAGA